MDFARIGQAFSLKANVRSLWYRPGDRYAAVDGFRALAMLWVVITHLCLALARGMPYEPYVQTMDRIPWLYAWVLHGEKALDTFFVISGFLIGVMLLAEHRRNGRIKLGRFFARRYLRLMPAYAVALWMIWLVKVEGPEKSRFIWANILYVNNFLPQRHMFMDWSWSLAVEEQFYVVMPLFLLGIFFRTRHRILSLAVLFALSFVIRAFVLFVHPAVTQVGFGEHFIASAPHFSSEYFDALYVNLATRFGPFVLGFGLAWIALSHEVALRDLLARHRHLGDGLLVLGTLVLACLMAVPAFNPHVTIPHVPLWLFVWGHRNVWSIGITFVMIAVLFPGSVLTRGVAALLSARIWFPIAQLSYCSYLFHLAFVRPGLELALHLLRPGIPYDEALLSLEGHHLLLGYSFTLLLSFLFGAFMYLSVERPFLNMRPR